MTAREHPVGQSAERVEIRALVEGSAAEGFGGHDRRRPRHDVGHAERRQRAEVEQLAAPVARHPYVARAQIAVEQSARVQERQRRRDVAQLLARFAVRHGRRVAHVVPREQLHRVVRALLVDSVVEDPDDSWMIERRQDMKLALERLHVERVVLRLRANSLERALFARDPVEYPVNDAHPARGELGLHDIAGRGAVARGGGSSIEQHLNLAL